MGTGRLDAQCRPPDARGLALLGFAEKWPHRFACAASDSPASEYQRHDEQDDEDDEQDLGDQGGKSRDAKEAKESGDDRNDQKNDGVVKHELFLFGIWMAFGLERRKRPSGPVS